MSEFTIRQASEESGQNYQKHLRTITAVEHVEATIARSQQNTHDFTLDKHRRAIARWHVQFWTEKMLPNTLKQLKDTDKQAQKDFEKHSAEYRQAALGEAILDGVEVILTQNN